MKNISTRHVLPIVATCLASAAAALGEERLLVPTELIEIARARSTWCFGHDPKDNSCSSLWRLSVGRDDQVSIQAVASFEDRGAPMRLQLTLPLRWDRGGFCYDLSRVDMNSGVYHARDEAPAAADVGRRADPQRIAELQEQSSVMRKNDVVSVCWSASTAGDDDSILLLQVISDQKTEPREVLTASGARSFNLRG